jgi:type I restriction-modification system DNA methylase subunit
LIRQYTALGAPQIFAIHDQQMELRRWKINAHQQPELVEIIPHSDILARIQAHRNQWNPEQILRAKSIAFRDIPLQLDFYDIGLLPTIEEIVQTKLDQLLQNVLAEAKERYQQKHGYEPPYKDLFRLVFRFIAAKLLGDRDHPGANWLDNDPEKILKSVENFYFKNTRHEPVLRDTDIQELVWSLIRNSFHTQNISLETLAYIYETTFVSPETRQEQDIHATPRSIAEYAVRHLPFEELPINERTVFEPFAGHAPFLTAAMARLRSLLPISTTLDERHDYLLRMLSGIEQDSFAVEIARYSLMLADYPNPNGWNIVNDNVFTSAQFDVLLQNANVVLYNPPFGDFDSDERLQQKVVIPNKAREALRRIMLNPPKMLGILMPKGFAKGEHYKELRKSIYDTFANIEVVGLPENIFRHSGIETVLFLAHGEKRRASYLHTAFVRTTDYEDFVQNGDVTWHEETSITAEAAESDYSFWYTPQRKILDELIELPKLGEYVSIHRGIEYNISVRENRDLLFSAVPKLGFKRGIVNLKDGFEPYIVTDNQFLNLDLNLMRRNSHLYPWHEPKLIVNLGRQSRRGWVISAALDKTGLLCYQMFYGLWSKNNFPLEVLASVINSPVANAFLVTLRYLTKREIERIPFPNFTNVQIQSLVTLVNDYQSYRRRWVQEQNSADYYESVCREILNQIDAEVLAAYNLPPKREKQLLDLFAGFQRPGPVTFERYYPEGFRPSIPWKIFISSDYRGSSASETVKRLPKINDPIISEMVRDLVS